MSTMPFAVKAIKVFVMLEALLLVSLSVLLIGIGASGHAGIVPNEAAMTRFYSLVIPPLLLFLLSIAAFVGINSSSRYGWYSSILLWVLSIAYLAYFQYTLPAFLAFQLQIITSAIVINALFIAYFNTRKVKAHFSR